MYLSKISLVIYFTMVAFSMHIGIGGCRKEAKFYHKDPSELPDTEYEPLDFDMARQMVGIPDVGPTVGLDKVVTIVGAVGLLIGYINLFLFIGTSLYNHFKTKQNMTIHFGDPPDDSPFGTNKNRNQAETFLGQTREDFSAHMRYASIVQSLCGAIQLDDLTYRTMKINFDEAVLHETLKFEGNSGNISNGHEKHLIL